jgi:glutamine amidotransferase
MQLLFEKGYEIEERDGLGIFKGKIERLPSGLKTPHMGWNSLEIKRECKILKDVEDGSFMYFVHSYYAVETGEEEVAATCDYGGVVPAVICKGNVFGTQFHPEKSGEKGLIIYKNFGELV